MGSVFYPLGECFELGIPVKELIPINPIPSRLPERHDYISLPNDIVANDIVANKFAGKSRSCQVGVVNKSAARSVPARIFAVHGHAQPVGHSPNHTCASIEEGRLGDTSQKLTSLPRHHQFLVGAQYVNGHSTRLGVQAALSLNALIFSRIHHDP